MLSSRSYTYSRAHRLLELAAFGAGGSLLVVTLMGAARAFGEGRGWIAVLACVGGLFLADFLSGVVHWAADTYGSPTMPIFGGFVRTFREHHTDALGITRHDFVETNGDAAILTAPVHLTSLLLVSSSVGQACLFGVFFASYANSQIHKWAHESQQPAWVRLLQRVGIVLSPEHHARHHAGAHLTNYCITTGWANGALDRWQFFRGVEWTLARLGVHRST